MKHLKAARTGMRLFYFTTGVVKTFIVASSMEEGRRLFAREVAAKMDNLQLRDLGVIGRAVVYCNGQQIEEHLFTVGALLEEAILTWKMEARP